MSLLIVFKPRQKKCLRVCTWGQCVSTAVSCRQENSRSVCWNPDWCLTQMSGIPPVWTHIGLELVVFSVVMMSAVCLHLCVYLEGMEVSWFLLKLTEVTPWCAAASNSSSGIVGAFFSLNTDTNKPNYSVVIISSTLWTLRENGLRLMCESK